MTITQEQRDALTQQLNASQIADAAKTRILAILAQPEISAEAIAEMQALIQADIDADIEQVAPGFAARAAADPELQKISTDAEAQVQKIGDDLDADMKFVAEQGAAIDQATTQLSEAASQSDLSDVKSRLGLAV